jgi:NAD-dependent SIR2 family protein deacetylase
LPPPPSQADKDAVLAHLAATPYLQHTDPMFFHGRAYGASLSEDSNGDAPAGTGGRGAAAPAPAVPLSPLLLLPPQTTWASKLKPRDDHDASSWLTASEFADGPPALAAKVQQLAQLLRMSRRTVVYSGAGISRAAGIGQAARGGSTSSKAGAAAAAGAGGASAPVPAGSRSTDALPTFTHYALGALAQAGLVHGWVQQNHDGLPQKAGFPQEDINEIHGSWFDCSNPVVKYSGTLKEEQFPWMEREAEEADLVLVLGTSLGGLNADQVATKTAGRSRGGRALGAVMINLQQTEQDGKMSLRIFESTDLVLRLLLPHLGLSPRRVARSTPATFTREARVVVPYDRHGRRSETARMWLDLRDGAAVRLAAGHNVQGAQQPAYMHIGASQPYTHKGRTRKGAPGHGRVRRREDRTCAYELEIEGVRMLLGQWWLEAAQRGGPPTLPVVNLRPEFVQQ